MTVEVNNVATVEIVSKRIEANRRNAKKSKGPTTEAGKAKVRLNAMKHGMTAKLPVALPGEDPEVFKARFAAFKGDLKPQSFVEEHLAERAAFISLQIERCDRAIDAMLSDRVRYADFDAEEAEADLVEDLTRRLFWDPRGPIALYPHFRGFRYLPRISSPETVDDPLNPARIVNRLEHLALGCRWLLDRWTGLRQLLEDGLKWQAPDRLRAIRLLGRQPMDALDDDRVLMIYLACDAMDPTKPTSFDDLLTETTDDELKLFKERVRGRGGEWKKPASPEAGKAAAPGARRASHRASVGEARRAPGAAGVREVHPAQPAGLRRQPGGRAGPAVPARQGPGVLPDDLHLLQGAARGRGRRRG